MNILIVLLLIADIATTCLAIAIICMILLKLPRKYHCQIKGCTSKFDSLIQLNYHLSVDHRKEDYE